LYNVSYIFVRVNSSYSSFASDGELLNFTHDVEKQIHLRS